MVTESKRYHPTKFTRLFIYPLGFLIFIIALGVILILANGFSFTFTDGKLQVLKTGMIITNSRPTEAVITLDGKKYAKKTSFPFMPIKITSLKPGSHPLTIKKDGYRTWENNVLVKANLVSWVNYVLLFPNDLKISKVDNLTDKKVLGSSKNRRYLLVSGKEEDVETLFAYDQTSGSLNKIWPKNFVPNEDWLKNPVILNSEFNQNNDRILLTVKNGEAWSYAILETSNDGRIYALSTLKTPISKIVWSATDPNVLYYLSNKTLYSFNIGRPNEVDELAKEVIDFSSEKNRIIYYVTTQDNQATLSQMNVDGSRKETIKSPIKLDSAYRISYSTQSDALAVSPQNEKTLTVYHKVNGKNNSTELGRDVSNFKWSTDGRTIFYTNGTKITNFDWEEKVETISNTTDKIVNVDWYFDNNHYLVQTEKEFYVIDFDNTNKVVFSDKPIENFFPDPKYSSFVFVKKDGNTISNNHFESTF